MTSGAQDCARVVSPRLRPCPQTRADYKCEAQALREVGDSQAAARERDRVDERCRRVLCEETREQEEPSRSKGNNNAT